MAKGQAIILRFTKFLIEKLFRFIIILFLTQKTDNIKMLLLNLWTCTKYWRLHKSQYRNSHATVIELARVEELQLGKNCHWHWLAPKFDAVSSAITSQSRWFTCALKLKRELRRFVWNICANFNVWVSFRFSIGIAAIRHVLFTKY